MCKLQNNKRRICYGIYFRNNNACVLRLFLAAERYQSVQSKNSKGTSLPFILLIIAGYIAGISAKLITGQINYVLIAYILNLAIVSLNVVVYFRNVSLDKKRLQGLEA